MIHWGEGREGVVVKCSVLVVLFWLWEIWEDS